MKILIVQLANSGEIYQTIPSINALKRKYLNAQIDILVGDGSSDVVQRVESLSNIHRLNTDEFIQNVSDSGSDLRQPYILMDEFCENLRSIGYDQIINLTYTALSASLVDRIVTENSKVSGYSRFNDGSLKICDETSAYIHAQVGAYKANRFHLTDLYAGVAGVLLEASDYIMTAKEASNKKFLDIILDKKININYSDYIIVQMGFNHGGKTLSPSEWATVLKKIPPSKQILLTGLDNDREMLKMVLQTLPSMQSNIIDLVGETSLAELEVLVSGASTVISCDNLLMHMSSLKNIPGVKILVDDDNFYERGPLAQGSMVIKQSTIEKIGSKLEEFFCNSPVSMPTIVREDDDEVRFKHYSSDSSSNFSWDLIKAIYLDSKFPILDNHDVFKALLKLSEITELAQFEILNLKNGCRETSEEILLRVDEMITAAAKMCPQIGPIVEWFNTERQRIEPGEFVSIYKDTQKCFEQLSMVLGNYIPKKDTLDFERSDLDLV